MTLYINCCVRGESRTDRLARAVLGKMGNVIKLTYQDDLQNALGNRDFIQRAEVPCWPYCLSF